jgi:hypothetical protein
MKKMLRSFRGNKRGVSEVIASLIILLIVSLAGAGLYSYSLTTFGATNSSFQAQTDKAAEQARERFLIIAVWVGTANQLNITTLNYGKIELAINAVYIDGKQVSVYASGKDQTIAKGTIASIKFTSPVSILVGQTYEIIGVSERGSRDVVYWKA